MKERCPTCNVKLKRPLTENVEHREETIVKSIKLAVKSIMLNMCGNKMAYLMSTVATIRVQEDYPHLALVMAPVEAQLDLLAPIVVKFDLLSLNEDSMNQVQVEYTVTCMKKAGKELVIEIDRIGVLGF